MKRIPVRALATIGCAVALAAGPTACGSDDSSKGAERPKSLSAADFKEKANGICSTAQGKIDELGKTLGETPTSDDVVAAFAKVGGIIEDEVADLRDLAPPKDIADDVDAMLDSVSAVAEKLKNDGASLLSVRENPFDDANDKASELGLTECASSGE